MKFLHSASFRIFVLFIFCMSMTIFVIEFNSALDKARTLHQKQLESASSALNNTALALPDPSKIENQQSIKKSLTSLKRNDEDIIDFWIEDSTGIKVIQADGIKGRQPKKFSKFESEKIIPESPHQSWVLKLIYRNPLAISIFFQEIKNRAGEAVLVLILGLAVAIVYGRNISRSIRGLQEIAHEISKGNLDIPLDSLKKETTSEIEDLSLAFKKMIEALKEEKGANLLQRELNDNMIMKLMDMNKELKKADNMKTEFLSNMSHEFRTPINVILGNLSLLEEGVYGEVEESQKNVLSKISRNTDHLLQMLNEILDFSKLQSGMFEFEKMKVHLKSIILESLSMVDSLAKGKNVDLNHNLKETGEILGDEVKIRQVILNLIYNALKFTEKGSISVFLTKAIPKSKHLITFSKLWNPDHSLCYRIEIKDTGTGIPIAKQREIFEPFRQADGSTTRKYGGTGLGLAITKRLVEGMGGAIGLESEPEKGSSFFVYYPINIDSEKT